MRTCLRCCNTVNDGALFPFANCPASESGNECSDSPSEYPDRNAGGTKGGPDEYVDRITSKTPRTDRVSDGAPEEDDFYDGYQSMRNLARQLERELQQSKRLYEITLANEIQWMKLHSEVSEAEREARHKVAELLLANSKNSNA